MKSMKGIFAEARKIDEDVIIDKNSNFLDRINARANLNGRKFIIGSISGVARLVVNVVQIPFALIAATFCLLIGGGLAIASLLVKNKNKNKDAFSLVTGLFLAASVYCLEYSYNKFENIVRGTVEIIPFTGLHLAVYDLGKRKPSRPDIDKVHYETENQNVHTFKMHEAEPRPYKGY